MPLLFTVDAGLPVRYGPTVLGLGGLERCGTDTTALVCTLSVGTARRPQGSRTTHPRGRAGRALRPQTSTTCGFTDINASEE